MKLSYIVLPAVIVFAAAVAFADKGDLEDGDISGEIIEGDISGDVPVDSSSSVSSSSSSDIAIIPQILTR